MTDEPVKRMTLKIINRTLLIRFIKPPIMIFYIDIDTALIFLSFHSIEKQIHQFSSFIFNSVFAAYKKSLRNIRIDHTAQHLGNGLRIHFPDYVLFLAA